MERPLNSRIRVGEKALKITVLRIYINIYTHTYTCNTHQNSLIIIKTIANEFNQISQQKHTVLRENRSKSQLKHID